MLYEGGNAFNTFIVSERYTETLNMTLDCDLFFYENNTNCLTFITRRMECCPNILIVTHRIGL